MLSEGLNRVLVFVQTHLDEDLGLERLAAEAGLSRFHFAREFRRAVGESVKGYTQRLRLERAAFRLSLHRGSVLQIALDCGYHGHETFTRAFRRRFGLAPRDFVRLGLPGAPAATRGARPRELEVPFALSRTTVRDLDAIDVAFIRHVGPYEAVSESLWDELSAWARRSRIPAPHVLLGLGHDAPGITPPERLRFDAALRVPAAFAARGRIGHQVIGAGAWAVTTHVGAYSTLPSAYQQVFPRVLALAGYRTIGLPVLEAYHATRIEPRLAFNHTDMYIPVAR